MSVLKQLISNPSNLKNYVMKKTFHLFLTLTLLIVVPACTIGFFGKRPGSSLYCENFLIYDMCAQDLNGDGVVEYVYFEDTKNVFMYREGTDVDIPRDLSLHPCAQLMDEELIATTSRVFYVNEETTYLERQDIRGAMMLKYVSYMPRVVTCNLQNAQVESDKTSS